MERRSPFLGFLVTLFLASVSVRAQTIVVSSATARAEEAFESACGDAWGSVLPAVLSGNHMHIDDIHASQARCLLQTLAATTFDARDAAADQRYVDVKIGLLVAAYDSSAHDFFAAQVETSSPRVRRGLLTALGRSNAVQGPLNGVCTGEWNEAMNALMSLRQLHGIDTREVRERVICLLGAISTARFDVHDDRWSDFVAGDSVHLLVSAYGPEGYEFFASQIPHQTDRIRRALIGTLMQRGHPDAFAAYFAARRERDGWDESRQRATAGVLGPLIERGECAEPACSTRINETLRIVSGNLDIVEADLRKASEDPSYQQHQRALDLLQVVARIRHGEATLGQTR